MWVYRLRLCCRRNELMREDEVKARGVGDGAGGGGAAEVGPGAAVLGHVGLGPSQEISSVCSLEGLQEGICRRLRGWTFVSGS